MNKVRVLVFDGKDFTLVTVEKLDDYYKLLECDCFDIAQRKIGGVAYDIFVDDIGLFRDKPLVTAVDPDGHPMLVGNLLFANHDGEGNTTSLSDEDVLRICGSMGRVYLGDGSSHYVVICEY